MGKLFGTDGIRGVSFKEPITQKTAFKLGRAVLNYVARRGKNLRVVLGRDTRESGLQLEHSIVSGILTGGGEVLVTGQLPTPAVALLTRENNAGAGIVISASHNPYEYNGFKLFSDEGYKLSEEEENEIEELMDEAPDTKQEGQLGRHEILKNASLQYESFLKKTMKENFSIRGMKIVLDCANGATWQSAPRIFKTLGGEIEALAVTPNGKNINRDCGSEHTDALKERVIATKADAGLAFDGDGDRLVAVDERGASLTGDQIIAICARMLKSKGKLKNDLVVSTIMSNMGLGIALRKIGVNLTTTDVGDRHVMEEMRARNAILGGEDSGHIIFSDHHTTGDGLISALQLLTAVTESGSKLSELTGFMKIFPQTLINVRVTHKPEIKSMTGISSVISNVKKRLGNKGRVLVRYSGTEPLCRVMVEGETEEETSHMAADIASAIEKKIGIR